MSSAVIVSVRVAATPLQAFEAFTRNIGAWWRPHPLFPLTPAGDGVLAFEPGEGGRLVTTLDDGTVFEIGRISVWQPGERLVTSWRTSRFGPDEATELEVRFEPVGEETRVTVEHRAWDTIPQASAARHGAALMPLQQRLAEHWRASLAGLVAREAG